MKYLYYSMLVIFGLIGKIIGLFWYWIIVYFRAYARNTIYNYVLRNNKDLKRLYERSPKKIGNKYYLNGYAVKEGYIKYRYVTSIEYYFTLFVIWIWLDDDSDCDTFCYGHNLSYINGERKTNKYFLDSMITANSKAVKGSSFDAGDKVTPQLNIASALIWNGRNTLQNFGYMFTQTSDINKVFYFEFKGLKFGWEEDGNINNVKYYRLIFGYNF